MTMVYQQGIVYEKGARRKKWYGQFRVYLHDQNGKEIKKNKKVVLGLKSELKKHQAEEKLRQIIQLENGKNVTRPVKKPKINAEQIKALVKGIKDPHDKCLMSVGLFCALRTSEAFGVKWKAYLGDTLVVETTAYEGEVYDQVKTEESRNAVPIPEDVQPIIEAWKRKCLDTSPEALMFSTFGRGKRKKTRVPFRPKNFLKWRIYPISDKLEIPRKLVTFQVMRRTLGTDLQKHGTMKDAQTVLRHASIKTTANEYMQPIPESVRAALNSRTQAVLGTKKKSRRAGKVRKQCSPNAPQFPGAAFASA